MAYGYYLEAEYQDGYVHSELTLADSSPFVDGKNIFNDIIHGRPSEAHGKMVRLSLIGADKRHDIDWSDFPNNAKPIYYRKMERQLTPDGGWVGEAYATNHYFGYEFHNEAGELVKEIIEI